MEETRSLIFHVTTKNLHDFLAYQMHTIQQALVNVYMQRAVMLKQSLQRLMMEAGQALRIQLLYLLKEQGLQLRMLITKSLLWIFLEMLQEQCLMIQ